MSTSPEQLFAIVVGIDEYEGGQQWQLTGPVADAVRFTNWLARQGVPAENVRLFISQHQDSLKAGRASRTNDSPPVSVLELPLAVTIQPADQNTIYRFLDESLRERNEPALVVFWGGHGMLCEKHGHQRLFCSDAKNSSRRNLDLESILSFLQTTAFRQGTLLKQHFIIDACAHFEESANWTQYLPSPGEFSSGKSRRVEVEQSVVFATRRGHRADNLTTEATGLFSRELLGMLDSIPSGKHLPEFEKVFDEIWTRYEALRQEGRAVPMPQYVYRSGQRIAGLGLGDVTLGQTNATWLEKTALAELVGGLVFDRDAVTRAFLAAWPAGEIPTTRGEPAEWFLACFDVLTKIPPVRASQQWTLLAFLEFLRPEFRRLNLDFAAILAWAEPVARRLGIDLAGMRDSQGLGKDSAGWKELEIPHELSSRVNSLKAEAYIPPAAKSEALIIFVSSSDGGSPPWAAMKFPAQLDRATQLGATQLALRFSSDQKAATTLSFIVNGLIGGYDRGELHSHIFIVTHGENISQTIARLLLKDMNWDKPSPEPPKAPVRPPRAVPLLYRVRRLIALTPAPPAEARSPWGSKFGSTLKRLHGEGLPHPLTREFSLFRKSTNVRSLLARELSGYTTKPRLSVAHCTAFRAINLERESGSVSGFDLVPSSDGSRQGGTILGSRSASQADVLRLLTARLQIGGRDSPDCVFVTGSAGLVKSILLRRFARNLAAQVLTSAGENEHLPIFIPLQQIGASDVGRLASDGNSEGVATWDFSASYWCSWASDLIVSEGLLPVSLTPGWLDQQMMTEPTVLILDGVDEFLAKNRLVVGHFVTVLKSIRTAYSKNPYLLITLGVRSTMPGLKLLTESEENVYEIAPLTATQAERVFPGTRKILKKIKNPQARELILTPLILSRLGPHLARIQGAKLETRSEILSLAVDTIVDRCASCVPPDLDQAYRGQWLEALAIVSWVTFSEFRGHISLEAIATEANKLYDHWRRHLETSEQTSLGTDLLDGFRLLLDRSLLSHLFTRTVFQSIGTDVYRFEHKYWEDFLVSRYLSHCVRLAFVSDLGKRAFLSSNFLTAGEILGRDARVLEVGADFAHRVFEEAARRNEEILIANAAAFIGNTWAPVAADCVRTFLDRIVSCSEVVRQVALFTFYFRALRSHPQDSSCRSVRHEVVRALKAYQTTGVREEVGPLILRAAWAYQTMLASRFKDVRPPSSPWPGTALSADEKDRALELVAMRDKTGQVQVGPLHRSLQVAFTLIQYDALEVPEKIVGACLYLYSLAAAAEHGALVWEADELLSEILEPKSATAQLVASTTELPVLMEIFQYCRTLINQPR